MCGGTLGGALTAACATEMIHASSLILDDLPAMDDAPVRRGKPASHIVFGEAIAILAAFGLLGGAFGAIARSYEPPLASRMTALLSEAVGADGLIGGQAADLLATDQQISFEMLERIHRGKTGALFSAASTAGAMAAGAPAESIAALQAFRRTSGSPSRSSTTCSTSKAIQPSPENRCAETPRRPRSCRSADRPGPASWPPNCATPPTAHCTRSAGARSGCASCRSSWPPG
jgi:hypothetical protein